MDDGGFQAVEVLEGGENVQCPLEDLGESLSVLCIAIIRIGWCSTNDFPRSKSGRLESRNWPRSGPSTSSSTIMSGEFSCMQAPINDTKFGCFPIPAKIESSSSKRSFWTPHKSSSVNVLIAHDCPLYIPLNTVPKRPSPTLVDI